MFSPVVGQLPLVASLVGQTAALALLRLTLGRRVWAHAGALFVVAAVLYHGVGEVANRLVPGGVGRIGLDRHSTDSFVAWVGPAILVFTLAYVVALGKRTREPTDPSHARSVASFYNWRILLPIVIPMYGYTLLGRANVVGQTSTSIANGLIEQLLSLAVVLMAFSFLVEKGPRALLPVLGALTLSMTLLGQRSQAVLVLLPLAWMLALVGFRPARRHVALVLLGVALGGLALSASRGTLEDRTAFSANSGPSTRVTNALRGFGALAQGTGTSNFATEYVHRIDGNQFGAFALAGIDQGTPPVGLRTFKNDLLLTIPLFLKPDKLNSDVTSRNEEQFIEERYQMGPLNRLPTFFGTIYAYGGAGPFLAIAAGAGALFAWVERWMRRATPVRMLVGVTLMICVAGYEQGVSVFPIYLRGAVALAALVKAVQLGRDVLGRVSSSSSVQRPQVTGAELANDLSA